MVIIESRQFFCVTAQSNGRLIKANKLWRNTFRHAINLSDIVHPEDLPNITCTQSDVACRVLVGSEYTKSLWFILRQSDTLWAIGVLLDIRTASDDAMVSDVLFRLNHGLMSPIASLKGLVSLLEADRKNQEIINKINSEATRIDDFVRSVNLRLGE